MNGDAARPAVASGAGELGSLHLAADEGEDSYGMIDILCDEHGELRTYPGSYSFVASRGHGTEAVFNMTSAGL